LGCADRIEVVYDHLEIGVRQFAKCSDQRLTLSSAVERRFLAESFRSFLLKEGIGGYAKMRSKFGCVSCHLREERCGIGPALFFVSASEDFDLVSERLVLQLVSSLSSWMGFEWIERRLSLSRG
jgi:hypothetical protein